MLPEPVASGAETRNLGFGTLQSCREPRTVVSAVPSTLRIVGAKCRNTKPASSIANAPMRLLHWLSSAQSVHS